MAEEIENKVSEDVQEDKPTASDAVETPVKEEAETSTEKKEESVEKADVKEEKTESTEKADTETPDDMEAPVTPVASKRKGRGGRHVPVGIAYIKATFNNTLVSITDTHGGVVSWSSGGKAGFKGSRKSTAFAATLIAQDAARQAVIRGMHEVEVRVQGAGSGRESAVRGLQSSGLNISVIKDVTTIAHNGCRARKRRRV